MSGKVDEAAAGNSPGRGEAGALPRRHEGSVIGLIATGHFLSHFYFLTLPPLFPILKVEFGVSYVELGLAMTAYGVLGGFVQAPIGFVVDRLGPRRLLLTGLGVNAVSILLMGFVNDYWMLLVLAVFAGFGNSVFHPANYAILSGSVRPERLGRAFSLHTFSGFLGSACAPVGILALAYAVDWRMALFTVGSIGVLVWLGIALCRDVIPSASAREPDIGDRSTAGAAPSGIRLLISPPVLLFLAFFISYGVVTGGLRAFTVSALVDQHGLGLDQANAALTGFLFGVVGGILLAGVIVDRYRRYLATAIGALVFAAISVMVPIWLAGPEIALIAIMTVTGVALGAVMPPRDLMIRALIPPGDTGKVFGFVFVGFMVGGSVAPVFFGRLLDAGQPAMIFALAAVFVFLSLLFIAAAQMVAKRQMEARRDDV